MRKQYVGGRDLDPYRYRRLGAAMIDLNQILASMAAAIRSDDFPNGSVPDALAAHLEVEVWRQYS